MRSVLIIEGGGTLACEFAEPCGEVEDAILIGGLVVEGAKIIIHYAKGGKQNVEHEWVIKMAKQENPNLDICQALRNIERKSRKR